MNDFMKRIEDCIDNNIGVTFQLYKDDTYIMGKDVYLFNYFETEYGLELHDSTGEYTLCPSCEPEYDSDEDYYYYKNGDLTIIVIINK